MKISGLVEEIFAQAVALNQDGGMKNTIYALDQEIFILNFDHTLMLRFGLRSTEKSFTQPVSFNANDYDSDQFEEVDGKIVFTSQSGDFIRKKTCGRPEIEPEEVKRLYRQYMRYDDGDDFQLDKSVLELLDKELNHIEFHGQKGESIRMVQRNIYSGSIIDIQKQSKGLTREVLDHNFGPVAIRTNDFTSLYYFQPVLNFTFPSGNNGDYLVIRSIDKNRRDMTAIVACCIYDEIIKIQEAQHGGQEQEVRRGKSKAD